MRAFDQTQYNPMANRRHSYDVVSASSRDHTTTSDYYPNFRSSMPQPQAQNIHDGDQLGVFTDRRSDSWLSTRSPLRYIINPRYNHFISSASPDDHDTEELEFIFKDLYAQYRVAANMVFFGLFLWLVLPIIFFLVTDPTAVLMIKIAIALVVCYGFCGQSGSGGYLGV